MTTLLAPEFERYLTRRATWIGGVIAVAVLAVVSLLITAQNRSPYMVHELRNVGPGLILLATVVAGAWGYFTAASAIGSEQTSGALGTWLTFNPRRPQVFVAKLVAVVVPTLVVAIVAMAAAVGWAVLISSPSAPGLVADLFLMGVRGALLAGSFAALGLVIAVIGKHALSALGVLVAWLILVVLQMLFGSVLGNWEWIGLERVIGEFLFNSSLDYSPDRLSVDLSLTLAAGTLWFIVVGVIVAIGAVVFARRDVH